MKTRLLIIIGIAVISTIVILSSYGNDYLQKIEYNEKIVDDIVTNKTTVIEQIVEKVKPHMYMCAYIGFDKYPQNLFEEFLENRYNKDVTFLNFIDNDLKQIPEFYDLVLEAEQMDYPLNKRVHFEMSTEEILKLRNYLEHRPYYVFNHSEETLTDQLGTRNIDGHYRHPGILIDENFYEISGLYFSPMIVGKTETMSVSLQGTLQEIKDWFIDQNNPKNPGIYYFEINEEDKIHLAVVLDAISQIQKSKDKIHMSEDVGDSIQNKSQDFFMEQNKIQFNNDDSKYTQYFILNGILYETSFVIC